MNFTKNADGFQIISDGASSTLLAVAIIFTFVGVVWFLYDRLP